MFKHKTSSRNKIAVDYTSIKPSSCINASTMRLWIYLFSITFVVANARPTFDRIADILLDIADEGRSHQYPHSYPSHAHLYANSNARPHPHANYHRSPQLHTYQYPANTDHQSYDSYRQGHGYAPQPQYIGGGYETQQYGGGAVSVDVGLLNHGHYQQLDGPSHHASSVHPGGYSRLSSNSGYNSDANAYRYGSQYPNEAAYKNGYYGDYYGHGRGGQQAQQLHYQREIKLK